MNRAIEITRDKASAALRSEFAKVAGTVALILALGGGVAVATISSASTASAVATSETAMRPLTIRPGVQLTRAFGPDDEDCVYATTRTRLPNGTFKASRELVCAD